MDLKRIKSRHYQWFFALCFSLPLAAGAKSTMDHNVEKELMQLRRETAQLHEQVRQLQHQEKVRHAREHRGHQEMPHKNESKLEKKSPSSIPSTSTVHNASVYVHSIDKHPESIDLYPAVLVAENQPVTYIAGTPVITAPYLGARPAFDGSDYIVNISSINRDIRLMQQRQQLYNAFATMHYAPPNTAIVALSGKVEPTGGIGHTYFNQYSRNWDLGSAELDTAASINDKVQAYISLAYTPAAAGVVGPRIANSGVGLGMGFINIGDLNTSPLYFTAGQIYVPFGRYSSSLVSATLPMAISRTKARPIILGYKSMYTSGPFVALYAFDGDTTLGSSSVGGANFGYIITTAKSSTELGISVISSINNAGGMQLNGAPPSSNHFGGFSSFTNGSEIIKKIPALDMHWNFRISRYIFTAEWVTTTQHFRAQDLSYNGSGAQPQAGQLEAAATFIAFTKPASLALGYQWSQQALALMVPQNRIAALFNISIWKDTVESLEYRHDIDYASTQYANGAAPAGVVNTNTQGTGKASDTVLLQIGVYF